MKPTAPTTAAALLLLASQAITAPTSPRAITQHEVATAAEKSMRAPSSSEDANIKEKEGAKGKDMEAEIQKILLSERGDPIATYNDEDCHKMCPMNCTVM